MSWEEAAVAPLGGLNALHYLQALSDPPAHAAANPERWLPWSYQDAIAALDTP